ncbi:hypothetical protein Tco_0804723 [Tanacetum coccineum]|uniref:Uncharacterized protein n=1 Tax=Tanacetum coccineum TaxID=301880 RepID=A0ABQ5A532_9ASTR
MINSRFGVSATLQYAVCTPIHQSKIRIYNGLIVSYLDDFESYRDSKEITPIADTAYWSSDTVPVPCNQLTKTQGIALAKPTMNDYILVTRKNFLSEDNNGKMIEKCLLEIEGTFLVKIHDNAYKGIDGENVFIHIYKFLEVVEPLKIRGLSHDRFRLSVFPTSLSGAASEWFTKECIDTVTTWENLVEKFVQKFYHLFDHIEEEEDDEEYDPHTFDDVPEIFKIEDDLFLFDTPLCIAFEEFNYLFKIDPDLFTYDIQGFKTYDEYEPELNNDKTQSLEESWSENGVPYQLCDHICKPYHFKNGKTKWPTYSSDIDGFFNGGELPRMVRVGTMTYFQDHKWYDELTDGKLKEETLALKAKVEGTWGDATPGVNAHEVAPFTRTVDFGWGPYANVKIERTHDPYLDTNRIFGNGASNVGDTQEDQGHEEVKDDPTPEQSICKIRRFKMMKYSFNGDEEYITIKESEHLNHSKKSLDAYRELLRLTNEGWVVTTPDE